MQSCIHLFDIWLAYRSHHFAEQEMFRLHGGQSRTNIQMVPSCPLIREGVLISMQENKQKRITINKLPFFLILLGA